MAVRWSPSDLNQAKAADILAQLSQYPIKTRVALTGTIVVARDIAHAKLKRTTGPMPARACLTTSKSHPVAITRVRLKTPEGLPDGQLRPDHCGANGFLR